MGSFPSSLTEEQQWANNYSQQNPVAMNGYSATADTQPDMALNQAAQYDGTPVRSLISFQQLEPSFQQEL